jgi:putative Mg2+ transporter-C (MgtC) family protein
MEEAFLRIILATLFGSLIGLEREMKKKGAGLQTYSLVCMGSSLFSIIAFSLGQLRVVDPSPIFMAIAVGMGFIGAGTIFKTEGQILGVTTAAGLWATAGVGLAVGAGFISLATLSTILILFIFIIFGSFEEKVFKK